MNRHHQAHAARCRHATATQVKAQYWAELDSRFLQFRQCVPHATASRFCSTERARIAAGQVTLNYRPSTLGAWLRLWRERAEEIVLSTESSTADMNRLTCLEGRK